MKYVCLIIVILMLSGCYSTGIKKEWVQNADANLVSLNKLNSKYNRDISILSKKGLTPDKPDIFERLYLSDIDKETRVLYLETFGGTFDISRMNIRLKIYKLWKISGNCLFQDIPCEKLADNAGIVAQRYGQFIEKNQEYDKENIYFVGLKNDIDLLQTEYCRLAIEAITKIVSFDYIIGSVYDSPCPDIPKERRIKIYDTMKKWFKENENNLIWNDYLGLFVDSRTGTSFRLPEDIISAL